MPISLFIITLLVAINLKLYCSIYFNEFFLYHFRQGNLYLKMIYIKKETSLDSPVFNPSLQNTESRGEISCDHVDNKCTNEDNNVTKS
jgi:hypothetical protein